VTRVVGLDPSLAGFGAAVVDGGQVLFAGRLSTGTSSGHARFEALLEQVAELTRGAQLVVIEGPSYGSRSQTQTGHHERAGLWWAVVQDVWRDSIPYVVVGPKGRAKYATGNGNAGKEAVKRAASVRFDVGEVRDDNVADALTLAAMGARWVLEPIDRLDSDDPLTPKRHAAFEAVQWPPVFEPVPA
jgi:Holliday junction resolvasome RuvABC endonuclease subunit